MNALSIDPGWPRVRAGTFPVPPIRVAMVVCRPTGAGPVTDTLRMVDARGQVVGSAAVALSGTGSRARRARS
jgi:hypothetical protein